MTLVLTTINEIAPKLGLKPRSLAVYLTIGDGPHAIGRLPRAASERGPGIGLYDRHAVVAHVTRLREAGFRHARRAVQ